MRGVIAAAILSFTVSPFAAAEVTDLGLCKGAISVVMNKDPSIIQGKMRGDEAYIHYVRPADGSRWDFKCKYPDSNTVVWAGKLKDTGQWGRWRDTKWDSIVKHSSNGNEITFNEVMNGSKMNSKTFSEKDLL